MILEGDRKRRVFELFSKNGSDNPQADRGPDPETDRKITIQASGN
jgi:hypothetical protein